MYNLTLSKVHLYMPQPILLVKHCCPSIVGWSLFDPYKMYKVRVYSQVCTFHSFSSDRTISLPLCYISMRYLAHPLSIEGNT